MLIRISSPAYVFREGDAVSDPAILSSLDGIVYDDERFTDFLGGPEEENEVALLLEEGGHLRFQYDPARAKLIAIAEYRASRSLTLDELGVLVNYTFGQWSDGIGENFVGDSERRFGYSIQCEADDPSVDQIEDGVPSAGNRGAPLFRAIKSCDLTAVAKALKGGAYVEARLSGCTPIHWAIGRQEDTSTLLEIIKLLAGGGANVNATDPIGSTPLDLCATLRDLSDANATRFAAALIEQGAKVTDGIVEMAEIRGKSQLREYLVSHTTQ